MDSYVEASYKDLAHQPSHLKTPMRFDPETSVDLKQEHLLIELKLQAVKWESVFLWMVIPKISSSQPHTLK
jgi:hypothetical protein